MIIRLQVASGVPITRQIADAVRAQIACGAVAPGDRLPSVRELARQLAVNQNTILRVYEHLTTEGLLDRRHGDGTYVSDSVRAGRLEAAQLRLLGEDAAALVDRARVLNLSDAQVRELLAEALARRPAGPTTDKGKKP